MSVLTDLTAGQMLVGKYRIEKTLGAGGMGAVFLAENVDLGRKVAIKVLLPQAAGNAEMVARFRQEARAAAAIGHPGIVDVLDLGRTEEGAEFIVMEHLRGETLGDRLTREAPLPVAAALEILGHLLDALEAAHRHGIVHRDLKPDNIFLVSEPVPTVKILDFGISKLSEQHEQVVRTATGAVMGTPLYMSPEQALAERDIGPPTDLYSLGAILYQMLGGRPPFSTDNAARLLLMITSEMPAPVNTLREDLPGPLGALVMDLLKKDPDERPGSATVIRQRLAGMGLSASEQEADETLAPLSTDETLAPLPAAATGPGAKSAALAETELSQPKITGPGTASGTAPETGDTRLTLPKKPTALWVGGGLVLVALASYPLIRYLGKDPAPAPVSTARDSAAPTAPDAAVAVSTPDAGSTADMKPPPDTDAEQAHSKRPRWGGGRKGRPRRSAVREAPNLKKPVTEKPQKPDAGHPGPAAKRLGLPSADQDKAAVKGGKRPR
jgi:serine/threonine-protein kinase